MIETFQHIPVLMDQVLELLDQKRGQNFLDCTLGGGHSEVILRKISPSGKLFGIDRDPYAIERAKEKLSNWKTQIQIFHGEFGSMDEFVTEEVFSQLDEECLSIVVYPVFNWICRSADFHFDLMLLWT